MGIYKNRKLYSERKNIIKNQSDQSIPNYANYNPLQKTIVFVTMYMPYPDKDSGSNRLKEIVLSFKEQGYNCIICCRNIYRTNEYVKYFSDLGIIVYVETDQYSSYLDFLQAIPNVNYVWYYGPKTLQYNLKKITKILPDSKSVYDMVDVHFLRFRKAIKIEPTRVSNVKNYIKYFLIETKLAKNVDYVVTISDTEKEIMTKFINPEKLITISNIHYPKTEIEHTLTFENRIDLLFIGSSHKPNIDAVYYLYKEIMPIVWEKLPDVKVNIIGNVNEKITDIIDSKFIFHGYVPNTDPFFISDKMMIAPLRYGGGVKGKIGQAFEYFLPVVTTSVGAEGMKFINQENALIGDSKEDFAAAIIELYNNKDLWLKLQENSKKSLEPFSLQAIKKTIAKFDAL